MVMHARAVTLKQLHALKVIVEAGSLTAAAARLNLTAPAVSTQLRTLESHLQVALLGRGQDGKVTLTQAGQQVLMAAERIDFVLTDCTERVAAIAAGHEGYVTLGAVSTAKYFLPHLIARLREHLPLIKIAFRVGNRHETIDLLENSRIEFAIMGRPPRRPEVDADVLGDHPHIFVARPSHPLAEKSDITHQDLLQNVILTREHGSGTRALLERYIDRIGADHDYQSIEFGSNETIKQAVMAGLGIAFISAHTIEAALADGRLKALSIPGFPIIRQWFLVRRRDTPPTPAATRVRNIVLEMNGSFLPKVDAMI
jgi:DNA-binding transcriptional LysR family regulator|tara:strand:+ start:986 stop:1924 length:939 start_codon:yes stop_codon:yes gene_type:complete